MIKSLLLWLAQNPVIVLILYGPALQCDRPLTRLQEALLGRRSLTVLAIFGVLALPLLGLGVVLSERPVDPVADGVAAIAASWLRGEELYPPPSSPVVRALPYGPLLFECAALWLKISGGAAPQLPGLLAGALAILGLGLLVGRRTEARCGLLAAAALALGMGSFGGYAWTLRAESLLLALVVLGLWAWDRGWPEVFGLALGMALSLKPHAALYFFPLASSFEWGRAGEWSLSRGLRAALGMVIGLVCPWLAPGVSLAGYRSVIAMTAQHGFEVSFGWAAAQWLIFVAFALSAFPIGSRQPEATRWLRLLSLALLVLLVPASKAGAGRHHILPILPVLLLRLSQALYEDQGGWSRPRRARAWALAAALSLAFTFSIYSVFKAWREAPAKAGVEHELRAAMGQGRVAIGFGERELSARWTGYRWALVGAGHPFPFNEVALADWLKAGWSYPEGFEAALLEPDVWLIPAGEAPFTARSLYEPRLPLMPEALRERWLAVYERRVRGAIFDSYLRIR